MMQWQPKIKQLTNLLQVGNIPEVLEFMSAVAVKVRAPDGNGFSDNNEVAMWLKHQNMEDGIVQ